MRNKFISLNPEINRALANAKHRQRRREWWEINGDHVCLIIKNILLLIGALLLMAVMIIKARSGV